VADRLGRPSDARRFPRRPLGVLGSAVEVEAGSGARRDPQEFFWADVVDLERGVPDSEIRCEQFGEGWLPSRSSPSSSGRSPAGRDLSAREQLDARLACGANHTQAYRKRLDALDV
jgi:hypothetical protein